MIEDSFSSIRPLSAQKCIHLEARVAASIWVDGDRTRLRQILFNLLSNAVKFTPDGGRVWIESAETDDFAEVSVNDSGIGVPAAECDAIFEKFHQAGSDTRGLHSGTGLGLPITRELVEQHDGRIRVRSEPGKGSCFSFTIPLHRAQYKSAGCG